MKVFIRGGRPAIDAALREHVERRLDFSLERFAPRIERTTVQLFALKSRLQGEEKACLVEVRLQPSGTVFVEGRGVDFGAAVDRATERIGRSVARALENGREGEGRIRLRLGPARPPLPSGPAEPAAVLPGPARPVPRDRSAAAGSESPRIGGGARG